MRLLLEFFFLPYIELFRQIHSAHHPIRRFFQGLFLFTFLLILWVNAFFVSGTFAYAALFQVADKIGIVSSAVHISGTGSMYPTFPKGTGRTLEDLAREDVAAPPMRTYPGGMYLFNRWYFRYTLQRGDIVSFSNEKTAELIQSDGLATDRVNGFVKRVIGLPGDIVEIRDGFVVVNGEKIEEPYIATPRSTFGGAYLSDCHRLEIPEGKVFVLGDNRKASNDSRHVLGLVDLQDITRVLPYASQTPYQSLWHDPSQDYQQSHTALLHEQEYIDKLNAIRTENGVKPLKFQPKLAQSAKLRAQNMLKYNDLSFEATQSGYTMEKAMRDSGYSNIIWAEAPTLGYYTADELLENYAEFPSWKKFLLDKRYQETGIAAVVGELNGCPVQIVVQHVAGYVPPHYKKEDIEGWKTSLDRLHTVLKSWEAARSFGAQYEERKSEYEKMIQLINERIAIAQVIFTKMSADQWLSEDEKALISKDKTLYQTQESLAKTLNER